jgi:hypothetical protein
VIASLAWAVFVLAPGTALALLIRPMLRYRPVLMVAVAPALGFVPAIVGAEVLGWAGLGPWPGVAILDLVLVVAAGARVAVAGGRRPRSGRQISPDTPETAPGAEPQVEVPGRRTDLRIAYGLLALGIAVGGVLWIGGIRPSTPPNADSQNHGYFVARIVQHNTIDPAVVLTESPVNPTSMARFYPLAIHVTVAEAHHLTDVPIADLLTAWTALTAVLCLPCGLFVLVRRLVPDEPVVAGLAALLGATVALFPYQPMVWGGLALVIGLSLVPGVLTLCLEAVDTEGRTIADIVVAALAVAGVTLAHTSQIALVGLVLAAFFVPDLIAARRQGALTARLRRWLLLGGGAGLLLVPWALAVATGSTERADHLSNDHRVLPSAVADLVTFDLGNGVAQPVMGALLVIGVVLVLRRPSYSGLRPLVAAVGVLAVLFVASLVPGAPWDQLRLATFPWYQSAWRIMYNLAVLAPVFAAAVVELSRGALRDRLSLPPAAATAVVAAVVLVLTVPAAHRTLHFAFDTETLLGPEEVALIEDFAQQVDAEVDLGVPTAASSDGGAEVPPLGTGSTVLNQRHDGTTWMYAVAGLPAFSGLRGYETAPDHADRRYVVEHLADVDHDPREQELLRRFDARYVMVNDDTYLDFEADITSAELREAGFPVLDHRGSLWIFQIPRGG